VLPAGVPGPARNPCAVPVGSTARSPGLTARARRAGRGSGLHRYGGSPAGGSPVPLVWL